jgi:hypothetical protein
MRIGKRIPFIIVIILGFFAVVSSAFAAPVVTFESNWAVTVDFAGNTPNAELLVEVWKYDANTLVLLDTYSETHTLNCNVPAGVKIFGDKAYFDGSAGIECALPSIQEIVYDLTKGEYKLPDECTCKTGAVVWADAQLRPNMSGKDWDNPIATMADIHFSSPIAANLHLRSNLEMTVDAVTAVSTPYNAPKTNSLLEGSFDEINPYGVPFYFYIIDLIADGNNLDTAPADHNAPLLISNVQPTLTIGYDSAAMEGFHGSMSELFVDPGCFGNGGY